jgi:hypothetical protein
MKTGFPLSVPAFRPVLATKNVAGVGDVSYQDFQPHSWEGWPLAWDGGYGAVIYATPSLPLWPETFSPRVDGWAVMPLRSVFASGFDLQGEQWQKILADGLQAYLDRKGVLVTGGVSPPQGWLVWSSPTMDVYPQSSPAGVPFVGTKVFPERFLAGEVLHLIDLLGGGGPYIAFVGESYAVASGWVKADQNLLGAAAASYAKIQMVWYAASNQDPEVLSLMSSIVGGVPAAAHALFRVVADEAAAMAQFEGLIRSFFGP